MAINLIWTILQTRCSVRYRHSILVISQSVPSSPRLQRLILFPMSTVPVWIECTTDPGGLNNIVTGRAHEKCSDWTETALIIFSPSSLLSWKTLNTFELLHLVCIWPTNMDRVIFNASGCHGELTLQPSAFCVLFHSPKERAKGGAENGQRGVPLSSSHLHPLWGRKGGREREKAAADHMSSWLSNSKLKWGAISWGPISRKLVLSVGVTPLGGGRGGWGPLLRETETEREGKTLHRLSHYSARTGNSVRRSTMLN